MSAQWRRGTVVVGLMATTGLVVGCASATSSPSGAVIPPTSIVTTAPTVPTSPTPARASPGAFRSLPPSQTPIEPGTYGWDGFAPAISFAVGPGWENGHRHPEFFDLFRGGDFPSVSFGRLSDVFTDATTHVPARDATTVVASLREHPDVTLSEVRPSELAGLIGMEFVVTASKEQSPLFHGPGGDFKMDPGFETWYAVLDLPAGGVLTIGVHARDGGLEEAIEMAAPVLASVVVER